MARMRSRSFLGLFAAALLSLQLHGWLHADHVFAAEIEICAACQLSQHGGSLQSHPSADLPEPGTGVAPAALPDGQPTARFAPRPQVRGPPSFLIS